MKTSFVLGAMLSLASFSTLWAKQPNLIIILADDLGYADVGFNGSKDIPTPQIDSIAAKGMKCTSAYVSYSVCSPSRAGLLTGRHQQRFGHERNPRWAPDEVRDGLPLTETTLADALGGVGYKTGIVGKWHLGSHEDLHPLKRGFDEFYGMLGGGHRYFPEELTLKNTRQAKSEEGSYRLWMMRDHTPEKTEKYLTDELSDEAVDFVKRHQEEPFFLYLSYNAPHGPLQATEDYLARFPEIKNVRRKTYAAMVSAIDDGVGRVMAQLRESDLEENTLVFFLSDNGGPTANASNNAPLRGHKSSVWEGGFRVPFAVQWPAKLPKGKVYEKPVSALDIFATIAAEADVKPNPERPLDGVNLVPYLTGEKDGTPHEAIYLRKFDGGAYAVRSGSNKLVIPPGKAIKDAELYDVETDIVESRNLAEGNPKVLAELEKLRSEWDRKLIAPVFGPGITEPGKQSKGGK